MSSGIALGVNGLEAAVGDHICGLYSGQRQRDQVVIPFLEAGLTAGDKCICVVDETDPAKIFKKLGRNGATSASAPAKQLDVIRAADLYLRSGRFSADEIIGAWKAAVADAMYDGGSTLCARSRPGRGETLCLIRRSCSCWSPK